MQMQSKTATAIPNLNFVKKQKINTSKESKQEFKELIQNKMIH
jgi:hypothetical protein